MHKKDNKTEPKECNTKSIKPFGMKLCLNHMNHRLFRYEIFHLLLNKTQIKIVMNLYPKIIPIPESL